MKLILRFHVGGRSVTHEYSTESGIQTFRVSKTVSVEIDPGGVAYRWWCSDAEKAALRGLFDAKSMTVAQVAAAAEFHVNVYSNLTKKGLVDYDSKKGYFLSPRGREYLSRLVVQEQSNSTDTTKAGD